MLGHADDAARTGVLRQRIDASPADCSPYVRGLMPSPHLERKLKAALGDDAGAELAAMTDRIDPILEEVAKLRNEMKSGFAALDARFAAQKAETDAAIRSAIEGQTRFFFVAWAVLLATIAGLYAR